MISEKNYNMIFLRQFENHSEYEAFTATTEFIKPNVSLCVQENEVHYNPYVDPYAGHEYVDLGLPSGTKWATMNVGASSETDYGNYYHCINKCSESDATHLYYYKEKRNIFLCFYSVIITFAP